MQQPASESQGRKKSMLVAGIGAAIATAGITAVLMSGNPTPSTTPAQTAAASVQTAAAPASAAAPEVKSCQNHPLVELASVENGGSGMIRFRRGDFVSQMLVLNGLPQQIVFPGVRPEGFPLKEAIIIEGEATNLVLGAEGDHYVIPRVSGSTTYAIIWQPRKC
jgi:hypothetical protein